MAQAHLRTDIQGLRALAVALVVVFHLSAAVLPGGYIGVDVFFVISGFLITGHLLREVERTGRISLTEFWARRVRRLLPAAAVVLIVSAIAAKYVLADSVEVRNLTEIGFAALYVLNWFLAESSVDYLAADNAPSIAQHYWSLSVEEQFYILWPIIIFAAIWAASRARRVDRRTAVAIALIVVLVLSLAYSIFETARSQPSAYFMTTTRAWEFALGGLVALVPTVRLGAVFRGVVSWAALLTVVASALLMDGRSPFPGWIALIPVGATATLIWLGDSAVRWTPQAIARIRPIQALGGLSYAVYLWHWPIIIVVASQLGRPPGWIWAGAIVLLTLVLSLLTKRWVEDPVRRAPGFLRRRVPTFACMLAAMLLIGGVGLAPATIAKAEAHLANAELAAQVADTEGCFGAYAVENDCADPYRATPDIDFAAASSDGYRAWMDGESRCSSRTLDKLMESRCDFPSDGIGVAMVGDSHTNHLMQPISALAQQRGWDFHGIALTGCTGFERADNVQDPGARRICIDWAEAQSERVRNDPDIDVVVISALVKPSNGFETSAVERLQSYRDAGKRVVVIRDVPGMEPGTAADGKGALTGVECVEAAGIGAADPCAWTPPEADDWLLSAAEQTGAAQIDPREIICADGSCHAVIGGVVVYFDDDHLSATFASTLVPWFTERLVPLVESSKSSVARSPSAGSRPEGQRPSKVRFHSSTEVNRGSAAR